MVDRLFFFTSVIPPFQPSSSISLRDYQQGVPWHSTSQPLSRLSEILLSFGTGAGRLNLGSLSVNTQEMGRIADCDGSTHSDEVSIYYWTAAAAHLPSPRPPPDINSFERGLAFIGYTVTTDPRSSERNFARV